MFTIISYLRMLIMALGVSVGIYFALLKIRLI